MSTELLVGTPGYPPVDSRVGRHSRRIPRLAPLAAALLLAAGCAPRTAGQLSAICEGRPVAQDVTLMVDSVAGPGGPTLQALRGREATVLVTLETELGRIRCDEQAGVATWSGNLPAPLESATDPDRRLEWRVDGDQVVVQFNPLAMDNNLSIALPLRGGPGRWSLSGLAGELASGRAIPGVRVP